MNVMAPRDKTACQTFPCKCKTCIFSVESDVYNKKKIQMFVVNMTFISSREVKKCIFHSCLRHSWNIHFFTSLYEIKVIFTPNIWISSIYESVSHKSLNGIVWLILPETLSSGINELRTCTVGPGSDHFAHEPWTPLVRSVASNEGP